MDRVLDSADVRRLVSMAEAIATKREAFAAEDRGGAAMLASFEMHLPDAGGEIHVKGARQELEPQILAAAGKDVPDSIDGAANSGELHRALKARLLEPGSVYGELTALASGRLAGWTAGDELTVAALATRLADEHGAGRDVPLGGW